ncbi:MAG: glycoside hydrolase family 38 C-terminal domain-containing protein [Armatimonadota bacterium]|nr:alpha-mannosidase [bacterium]
MSDKKVHLICNAHLDPVWLWQWEEGAAEAVSTFRTAADLCEEFDGFVFNHNEVILYRWVEEYEPELFKRIQRLVKEGKWHIMGGWYLQPDCNMPSGESFVRQILLGRTYFKEKFDQTPTTAINLDPFGHTRGLAQIMAKSGFDSYLICRPGPPDMSLDSDNFIWVGYDGSEVIVRRSRHHYNTILGEAIKKVEECLQSPEDVATMVLWGVGDHGGGPSRQDLRALAGLMKTSEGFDIRHSTPEAYFAQIAETRSSLPRREKDLNPWAVGCYTSQVRIKQRHRRMENEYYSLEKMASAAAYQGLMKYPTAELHEALFDLATSEFHDILPGSSIQPVEEMSLRVLDHGLEIISRLKARTFFALASGQPKANENEIPILVYNPHPFKVKTIVECEFQLQDANWKDEFTVTPVYQNGKLLPSQNEKEDSNMTLDWRKHVSFLAELEPSCVNRFDCRLEVMSEKPKPVLHPDGDRITFKTDEIEVIINTKTGLMDKYAVGGVDQIAPNAFEPIVIADNEDPWGMLVRSYRNVEGRFTLMSDEAGTKFSGVTAATIPSVRVIEDGPVRSVVEAVFEYGCSAICQHYSLPKKGTQIDIQTRVHWEEKNKMLKLSIPVPGKGNKYLGQVAYGFDELPSNGDEAVAQKWVAVISNDGNRTLTCVNDGVYGSDYSDDGLRLTLMRSPAYSGHPLMDRTIVTQDRYLPRIDQGERLFKFRLNGGKTSERMAGIDREALVMNEKPFALSFFPSGSGEKPQPLITLSDEAVLVTTVKKAENNDDLIIRLFEPTGKDCATTMSLPFIGLEREVKMSAFEIKTLRVDPKNRTVVETDLMENAI